MENEERQRRLGMGMVELVEDVGAKLDCFEYRLREVNNCAYSIKSGHLILIIFNFVDLWPYQDDGALFRVH